METLLAVQRWALQQGDSRLALVAGHDFWRGYERVEDICRVGIAQLMTDISLSARL